MSNFFSGFVQAFKNALNGVKSIWSNENPFNLGNTARVLVLLLIGCVVLGFTGYCSMAHSAELPTSSTMSGPWVDVEAGSAIVRGYTPAIGIEIAQPLPITRFKAYLQFGMLDIGESNFQGKHIENNLVWRAVLCSNFVSNFDACIGPSYMDNPDTYNGTKTNAALQLTYRFKTIPLALTYEHYSCAGSCSPNLGRDVALVVWTL